MRHGRKLIRFDLACFIALPQRPAPAVTSTAPRQVSGYYGIVMRYDTSATFTDNKSWSQFNVSSIFPTATSAAGAAFDGRFLYLPPKESTLVRYDTLAEFGTEGSWSVFDVTTVNAKARSFSGALFDGRHVYLIPEINGLMFRFDAKSPSALPMLPTFSGSFF